MIEVKVVNIKDLVEWEVIENMDVLFQQQKEWQKLCDNIPDSLFASPMWIFCWIETYWQDYWELKVIKGTVNNEIVVFAPLYIQKSKSFFSKITLIPLGQGEPEYSEVTSEYQDILIKKPYSYLIPELKQLIKKINFSRVYWNALLPSSNVLSIFSSFSEYGSLIGNRYLIDKSSKTKFSLSKNNRYKLNKMRKILNQRKARFFWLQEERYDEYWDIMRSFHQSRWNQKNKLGAFFNDDFSKFHSKFRACGKTKISVLELDGKPIAINYYLSDFTTLYFYQSGWDSDLSKLSPGFSLHMWSIESCTEKAYDFMMGTNDKSYKNQFGCNRIEKMYRVSGHKNKYLRTIFSIALRVKQLVCRQKGNKDK